jgi:hypothetical protein
MVLRKSSRQHENPNLEYVFDDSGREIAVIRDHATMRVSLMDAMASRGQQDDVAARQAMSDAEQRVADYMEAQRKNFYNKPGYRTGRGLLCDQEYEDGQTARVAAYDAAEKANAEAWRTLGGQNTQLRGRAFTGQRGSRVNDPCSINGAAGTLQYASKGELVCRVQSNSNDDPEQALSDAYRDHENY